MEQKGHFQSWLDAKERHRNYILRYKLALETATPLRKLSQSKYELQELLLTYMIHLIYIKPQY